MLIGIVFLVLTIAMGISMPFIMKRVQNMPFGQIKNAREQNEEIQTVELPEDYRDKLKFITGLKDVRNKVAVFENHYCIYIKLGTIDFHLLTEAEQTTVENALIELARTINFPVQSLVVSKQSDTRDAINIIYKNISNNEIPEKLYDLAQNTIAYLTYIMENRANPDYSSHLVIRLDRVSDYGKAMNELYRRAEIVLDSLSKAKIPSQVLDSEEILDLLYSELNPMETFKPSQAIKAGALYPYKSGGVH